MKVAITRCEEYSVSLIKEKLSSMINSTDFPDVKGRTVLVKPNILSDVPKEKALTTHPDVVEALIKILKEKGAAKILVGDSPGLQGPNYSARACGIRDVIEKEGVLFEDFSKNNREHVLYKNIKAPMACAIDGAVVISVAKFKTHQLMMSTGCVKNMFGLLPGLNKSPMHLKCPSVKEFSRLLISIFKESHTDYAILDGIVAMEGAGPANGTPRALSLLLSSSDAYAVDYAEAFIMGYQRKDMSLINEAIDQGLFDPSEIEYTDLDAKELIVKDFKRVESGKKGLFSSLLLPFVTRVFKIKKEKKRKAPSFTSDCIKCKRCIEICPAKALSMDEKHPKIDQKKCIRCYCCHEMCPVNAIKIT